MIFTKGIPNNKRCQECKHISTRNSGITMKNNYSEKILG